jgi:hypothetical protein
VVPELPVATVKFGERAPLLSLLLVIAEVPCGLVVVQVMVELQLLPPEGMMQLATERVPDTELPAYVTVAVRGLFIERLQV